MKAFLTSLAALLLSVISLMGQTGEARSQRPFYIAIQGGPLVSVNENYFSYKDNNKLLDLVTPQGSFAIGYDFSSRFGARLSANYGKNASSCNVKETNGVHPETGLRFFPYNFNNVSTFFDLTWSLVNQNTGKAFIPKLYAGVGFASTFGFTESGHPWQVVHDTNSAFGFRAGFIGEYKFNESFGAFFDLCAEAYTDVFNGIRPSELEKEMTGKKSLGFPFDLRGIASFGLAFHF